MNLNTAIPAVTLEAAKDHCRVDHDLEDALLEGMIAAATQRAEHIMGREIIHRDDVNALCESIDAVPAAVRCWILCEVADLYGKRETSESGKSSDGRRNFDHLLDGFRLFED